MSQAMINADGAVRIYQTSGSLDWPFISQSEFTLTILGTTYDDFPHANGSPGYELLPFDKSRFGLFNQAMERASRFLDYLRRPPLRDSV